MFEKFLNTPDCMKILSWMLNHPDGEYSAAIVGIECEMTDMFRYMGIISVLEGTGFVKINELSEEVMMSLNKDESIVQLLMHLKDEFNDKAFHSEHVSSSLAYLHSESLRRIVDAEMLSNFDADDIVDRCKNYKELDLSDKFNKDIYKLCEKLEETGEYEEFIEKLESGIEK